jgi:class 3 adenylate cyclase/CheY-like chemotaxis protein/tRNA A-37 threonylcarbamoyl transferase component Bud32
MARVLVVEDDAAMRRLVTLHLESETHDVITAEDGAEGLRLALEAMPDLIVSDVVMPRVDGMGMLTGIRANIRTAAIPFIFLTDREDDDLRSRAKSLRVADYLVKPLDREDFLRAVSLSMRPRKARRTAPGAGTDAPGAGTDAPAVDHTTTAKMARRPEPAPPQPAPPAAESDDSAIDGTVWFFAIREFERIAETVGDDLQNELMSAFHENVLDVVSRNSGWIVKNIDGGFIAMFEDDGARLNHAERAVKAAILCVLALSRFGTWVAERFKRTDLPALAAQVGVHSGQVSVCSLSGGRSGRTIIGEAVNVASRLKAHAGELGWGIVCSDAVLSRLGPRISIGRRGRVSVKGRANRLRIAEVTALQPRPGIGQDPEGFYAGLASAIDANTRLIEAQNAVRGRGAHAPVATAVLAPAPFEPAPRAPVAVDGYRILRMIGQGAAAQVYLADHLLSGQRRVLKLVPLDNGEDCSMVGRFVREYAALMQINHPNVARVFQHGHESTHAYMAMEYFPGGDLRGLIRRGCTPDMAVRALIQLASGLAAVHKTGVVHRDLKPDNIMIRQDGSMAIADFGIAKRVGDLHGPTRHGDVMGTPYYLSPEQALGQQADYRADIYSLGVIFYEMLSARRAYTADSAMGLLHQHAHSPVPLLKGDLIRYQPLIDRMMCKQADERFADADGIIDFARACGFVPAP